MDTILKKKKVKVICIMLIIVVLLTAFLHWQNNDIVTANIDYTNSELPQNFSNFKIVQISDLHNKSFGNNQRQLITKITKAQPDIIVITGDLIDKNRTDVEIAIEFSKQALQIAPVYYVSGNHEKISGKYDELKARLLEAGVAVLDNEIDSIDRNGEVINIIGLSDIGFYADQDTDGKGYRETLHNHLASLLASSDKFSVVLSHRPDLINEYTDCRVKLVLTGHAHGGQIRLPFIGGLIAPGQGLFPSYTSGSYVVDKTTMIVSRGLGNSGFPFRVFNRPEIVVITLKN